jgi:hypothetical protein
MGSFVTYTRVMNFDQNCLFVPDGDPQLQYVTRARGHHDASNGAVPCYTREHTTSNCLRRQDPPRHPQRSNQRCHSLPFLALTSESK